jgi:hypothetical protein
VSSRIRQRRRRVGIALLIIGVLLILASVGIKVVRVGKSLVSLKEHLDSLEKLAEARHSSPPGPEVIVQAGTDLIGVRDDLAALQTELRPLMPLCPYMGWVPVVGGDIQAAPDLLEVAASVTDGGALLFEGVSPFFEHYQEGGVNPRSSGLMKQGIHVLVSAEPNLVAARARFAAAAEAWGRVDVENLSPPVASLVERLDRYLPLIQTGVDGALIACRVMGGAEPRTLLILAQNDDELRATGGLISGAIRLTVQEGEIIDLSFMDSYKMDDLSKPYPEPPAPLRDYMAADLWLFRDANWSPDFPTAARDVEKLYELGQDEKVDGVIALDQQAVRLVIGALSPLHIEGNYTIIEGRDLLTFMRQSWSPDSAEENIGEWWQHRKDFMKDLLSAAMDKVQKDPESVDVMHLAQALHQSIQERHLLVYLHDPVAAQVLAENGWDGALRVGSGDYLMVVDTNMGFNKVNPNVQQEIAYTIDLTDASQPKGEVTITYHNDSSSGEKHCRQEARYGSSYEDLMNRCYWDYLRVVVPLGSRLVEATPAPLPAGSLRHTSRGVEGAPDTVVAGPGEKGTVTFGAFFVVKRGETRGMSFVYTLPPTVIEREGTSYRYRFLAQKQAGKRAVPLAVRVRLPADAQIVTSWPRSVDSGEEEFVYQLSLQTDQGLELLYR